MQCGIGDQIIPLSQRAARQHIQVLASTYLMEVWIVTHSWATRRLNIISHNKRGGSHGQNHFLFFFHIREMTAWHQFVISMSFRKCKLNLVGFDIMKSSFFLIYWNSSYRREATMICYDNRIIQWTRHTNLLPWATRMSNKRQRVYRPACFSVMVYIGNVAHWNTNIHMLSSSPWQCWHSDVKYVMLTTLTILV